MMDRGQLGGVATGYCHRRHSINSLDTLPLDTLHRSDECVCEEIPSPDRAPGSEGSTADGIDGSQPAAAMQ